VTMPRMSDTMEQGTVVKWHVKEGDEVSPGDVLADIETDKATMELEAFDEGRVAKLAVPEGANVAVGEPIVILAEDGEDLDQAASSSTSAPAAATKHAESTTVQAPPASTTVLTPSTAHPDGAHAGERIMASPLARKIAAEKHIDLATVTGTGPSGRITKRDLEQITHSTTPSTPIQTPAPVPQPTQRPSTLQSRNVPLTNMRSTIARRLVESKTTIPHYQVTLSARLDALLELRQQLNAQLESQGVKLSVNDFLVRACALAMHEHPFINSSWNDTGPSIDLHADVNIGVAVSLPEERGGGLVVATIRNADNQGLRTISSETKRLAKKAREKGLTPEEMSDSTFTISNLGMFGVDHFTAIINPPNAAILAVGRAVEKLFVETDEDGEPEIVVGHEMSMTISSDHRIIDGVMAAKYLASVKQLLESPAALLV
ncbi:MAG TPA: pyruvate dehydrogenase complex dihydrolipoamide acetyltransferase, partial [Phycisphaerales bacterium]|nr:pyruvate dehydrogenase complex dihydrolipoamide acetyltransferase [Phycisphaerales bacterium]